MRRAPAAAPLVAAAALLVVAACSPNGDDSATLTPQERSQLNDAAAMLDANSVALEDAPATNTSGDPHP